MKCRNNQIRFAAAGMVLLGLLLGCTQEIEKPDVPSIPEPMSVCVDGTVERSELDGGSRIECELKTLDIDLPLTPPTPNDGSCGTVYVGETNKAMNDAWEEMVIGEVPAKEALTKAAEIINECLVRGGA